MDIKFESRFYGTKKMYSEFIYRVVLKNTLIFCCILIVAFTVLALISNNPANINLYVCLIFMLVWCIVLIPPFMIRNVLKQGKKINNGKEYEAIVQFSDKIYVNEGNVALELEYSQIVKLCALKHSYVLMIGKTNGVLLSPEGFTIGTFEDFKEFIREMCPTAKIYK